MIIRTEKGMVGTELSEFIVEDVLFKSFDDSSLIEEFVNKAVEDILRCL